MGGRHQPSSIDKLPEEIKAAIGQLRLQGRTIDEILAHLETLDVQVSRSALGRHTKALATLSERMQRSRDMSLALVDRFGDRPDNQLARLNLELMQSVLMEVITATTEDEDGESRPLSFTAEEAMFLASALQKLASAEKTDADRTLKLKAEALKEAKAAAAEAVDKVARSPAAAGLTRDTIDAIKREILGIAA